MKFRLLLILLAIVLIAKGLGWCENVEPQKIQCNVLQPIERPGVWDVYIVTDPTPSQRVNQWVSEHQSRKSALKACDKIITAQEKRWKQMRKGKSQFSCSPCAPKPASQP